MAKYTIRPLAEADLDEQVAYIAQDNITAALNMYDSAEATYQQLAEFKQMGKPYLSDHLELANVRFFPIKDYQNYLVFYIPFETHIDIIRVVNSARDIENIL